MNVSVPAKITNQAVATFAPDQVDLIKRNICKGSTDDELKLFLHQCQRTGLDPFARQIYSIERREKRGDQWVTARSIQVSIDGFRLIAERTNKYAGQVGPFWCGEDGQWVDAWLSKEPPKAARVGILRSDFKEPCWGVARFDAYAQRGKEGYTRMWANMGDVMIAKCAEALGLRKAFPQELSGLYTSDEMDQATVPAEIEAPKAKASPIKPQEIAAPVNPETGKVSPHKIIAPDVMTWGASFAAAVKAAASREEIEEWTAANAESLEALPEKIANRVDAIVQEKLASLKVAA